MRPLVSFGHPVSQAPGAQVLPGPEDGARSIERVTDEIDAAGALNDPAVFVARNLTDLPGRFQLQTEVIVQPCLDRFHSLSEIPLTGAQEQQIVHISDVVPHPWNPLPASDLVELLRDVVIHVLEHEIGIPWAGIVADWHGHGRTVQDLLVNPEQALVLAAFPQRGHDLISCEAVEEMPDIELHEIPPLQIIPAPARDRPDRVAGTSPYHVPAAVSIHAAVENALTGQDGHVMHYVIPECRAVQITPFSCRAFRLARTESMLMHRRRVPPGSGSQIAEDSGEQLLHLGRIQHGRAGLHGVIRQVLGAVTPELPDLL